MLLGDVNGEGDRSSQIGNQLANTCGAKSLLLKSFGSPSIRTKSPYGNFVDTIDFFHEVMSTVACVRGAAKGLYSENGRI